jgi:peptidoglycan/LPS O-acetylase OafA/YrhL
LPSKVRILPGPLQIATPFLVANGVEYRPVNMQTGGEATRGAGLGYLPGLDGLRALAVGAVFLFHAGVTSGGFIGVDVFFVISGFLITALAVAEVERTDRLSIGRFWARRVRRLLPALLVLVGAVLVYSMAEGGAAARRIGRDVVFTLLYVANWAQIGEGRDYFATYDAPPLLEHAWSLAVEEQFYIVWPVVIAVLAYICRGRSIRFRTVVAAVAVAVAAASLVTTLLLRSSEGISLSRLYYGTDTRAIAIAVGAIAGALITPGRLASLQRRSRLREVVGAASAVGLVVIAVTINGSERWLYGPGFLVIALLSLALMYAAIGSGPLCSALSARWLVTVGTVSYGIYLWHWPVIVVLDGDRTGLRGPALGLLWVLATAVLAAASWLIVERRSPLPTRARPMRALAYTAVAVAFAVGAVVVTRQATASLAAASYAVPAPLSALPPVPVSGPPPAPVTDPPSASVASTVPDMVPSTEQPEATVPTATAVEEPKRAFPADRALKLLIVGDSVAASMRTSDLESYPIGELGDVEVRNVGGILCSIIQEGVWWGLGDRNLPDNPRCDGPGRYDQVIEEYQPDVVLMMFGWPGAFGGRQLDDGSVVLPCEPAFDERWLRDYREMVERMGPYATVVVSTVAPLVAPEEGLADGTRCLNRLVAQIDAPQFDYQQWLCPDYRCDSSSALRPDGVHFGETDQLRRNVMEAIVPQVVEAAGY